jgi:hypothetical protein
MDSEVDREAVVTGQQQVVRTRGFSISARDFVALQRRMLVSRRGLAASRRQLAVYAVLVALLVVMAVTGSPAPLIVGAAGWVLGMVYCMTLNVTAHARKIEDHLNQERHHTFSDDAVVTEAATDSSRTPWGDFTELRVLGGFFVLITTGKLLIIVPRQAFESASDANRFRELATRRIAESTTAAQATQPARSLDPKTRVAINWRAVAVIGTIVLCGYVVVHNLTSHGGKPLPYSPEIQQLFLSGCDSTITSNVPPNACHCMLRYLEAHVSWTDLEITLDGGASTGGEALAPPTRVERVAQVHCGGG